MNADLIRELLAATLAVSRALDAAEAVQWEKSPIPSPREDTSSRSSGGYSNPTADITLDPRRLAVRESVKLAEEVAATAARELTSRARSVLDAVDRWQGETE
ncbi:hypothetical protein SEA_CALLINALLBARBZ_43 [Arthrobacter phage CallinAllBarbz]|uniref:Uncharacterized protein n=1 Tax=Arthrobacter phage CallinAllBarbz TaxID=3077790 RepID=A0AA96HD32_9CAUD|nr:hypothetical protein SEA_CALLINALLBARBZ_43 [Arthrobacter phage CallinAllBarbz]